MDMNHFPLFCVIQVFWLFKDMLSLTKHSEHERMLTTLLQTTAFFGSILYDFKFECHFIIASDI